MRKQVGFWRLIFISLIAVTLNMDIVILWATPSAAGPRSLLIAVGLQNLGIVATGSWHPWFPDLSFDMLGGLIGVLGHPGTILGH